jgi:hypothetical protein
MIVGLRLWLGIRCRMLVWLNVHLEGRQLVEFVLTLLFAPRLVVLAPSRMTQQSVQHALLQQA